MAKYIDLGNGYTGKVMAVEPGLESWMILDSGNRVIHTGYAPIEKAADVMKAFLTDAGDRAEPESEPEPAEEEKVAEPEKKPAKHKAAPKAKAKKPAAKK